MSNDPKHDDGCRCQACCREKFKTIDPARFGKAPTSRSYLSPPRAALPYGDPCPRCEASSTHVEEQFRVCLCVQCPTCKKLCGTNCGYCGGSLGCSKHRIEIEEHVASACTAGAARREEVDAACRDGLSLPPVEVV